MDAKNFIALLKKPNRFAETDFSEMIELGKKYPYTSLIHSVIAKKSETDSPDDYDNYLAKAAIYSLDRKKLYYIINSTSPVEENITEEIPPSNDLIQTQENIPLSEKTESVNPLSVIDNIDLEENALDISDEKDEDEIEQEDVSEKKKDKKKKKSKKKHKEEKAEKELLLNADAKLSFTEWLKYISKHKISFNRELEENYAAAQYEATIVQEEKTDEIKNKPELPSSPIEWKKQDNKDAEILISDLAERSIRKDEGTITETFAKILELQKKYTQAIDAYKKLSLKYPEKSTFFALRIEELKKKI